MSQHDKPAEVQSSTSSESPDQAAVDTQQQLQQQEQQPEQEQQAQQQPAPPEPPKQQGRGGRSWRLLFAGGMAGAVARTCTAPLDRIKLLLQVQHLGQLGTSANAYTGVSQAIMKIGREEGIRAFWKGNGLNIVRIFPYSASQFTSHEQYKILLAGPSGQLTVPQRLMAGAMAGMTATALTHPLDTVRLRMAMPTSGYSGISHAFGTIIAKEGPLALYKGIFPTLLGIAPYAALNFASYDLLKSSLYKSGVVKESIPNNLLMGATAGTIATTVCYPLDTVRRRMQMKGKVYSNTMDAFATMARTEGARGFYRGWWANTLKVVPQNSIRFVAYEFFKSMVGVKKAKTDT
ncbi:unnamed protein product [Closterium sp. NIES-53]